MDSTAMTAEAGTIERLQIDHGMTKRLGHWTSTNRFEVRARSGALVLDLRSPAIQGDVEIRLDLHRSVVKLLLAEGDQVDHWNLGWTGQGRIKDDQRPVSAAARATAKSGCTVAGSPSCRPCSPARTSRTCGRPAGMAPTRRWTTRRGRS